MNFNDLKPNIKNPRTMSKHDAESLKKSITEFGDLSGIVFNQQTGQLVGGHQRIETFKRMDGKKDVVITQRFQAPNKVGTVAVGYVTYNGEFYGYRVVDWPLDRETAANIAANRIQGEFDLDLLAEMDWWLKENNPDLLQSTGQTDKEISHLLDAVGCSDSDDEDESPEVDDKEPPVSKLGEIYQLGRHRLMCGDSTDFGHISELMDGHEAKLVHTDPPYGVSMNRSLVDGSDNSIMNDDLDITELKKMVNKVFANVLMVAPNASMYWWIGFRAFPMMVNIFDDNNIKMTNCIVWVKPSIGLGSSGYRYRHELCAFYGKVDDKSLSDVWEYGRDSAGLHPTMKPVDLVSNAIKNSSQRGDILLDVFGGSGSTLIAADQLDRTAFVMELDPKYCDVIRKRYAKHIGQEDWVAATPVIEVVDVAS